MVLDEQILQAAIGQFRDNDQFAFDGLDAIDRQQEGVANRLDVLNGPELVFGMFADAAQSVEVAVDKLDGLEDAAGGLALPDFAEAAVAQQFQQAIARNRLSIRFFLESHVR